MDGSEGPLSIRTGPSKKWLAFLLFLACLVLCICLLLAYSLLQSPSYLIATSITLVCFGFASLNLYNENQKLRGLSSTIPDFSFAGEREKMTHSSNNNGRFNIIDFAHNNKAWNHLQNLKENHVNVTGFAHNNKAWSKVEEWKKGRL